MSSFTAHALPFSLPILRPLLHRHMTSRIDISVSYHMSILEASGEISCSSQSAPGRLLGQFGAADTFPGSNSRLAAMTIRAFFACDFGMFRLRVLVYFPATWTRALNLLWILLRAPGPRTLILFRRSGRTV
ncbi:hypothetical protein N7G274_003621 [Stereocaulon virgatum]|uniref:Uncharacterized protein n=1 Tax=Stereocaulon virgatum TaxID=373712 RepID=A0ABR4ACU6_9LECA